ncbi:putative eka-like protein, partial [Erysiphe neolycopersici]
MLVDYFSRFVWAFPCSTPDQAEAIRCLIWLFSIFGTPISIYADIGTHFTGGSMARFLQDHKVLFTPAPSGAKRATGMVEKMNDLLERILKKQSNKSEWP